MFIRDFCGKYPATRFSGVFLLAMLFAGNAIGQAPAVFPTEENTLIQAEKDSSKESAKEAAKPESEKAPEPPKKVSGIRVVFDEKEPGVMFIESNGEKIRVDANKKTIDQIAPLAAQAENTAPDKALEAPPAAQKGEAIASASKEAEKKKADKKKDDSLYDFEAGSEPYDYRLINIPTPKKVPKKSWNLGFSHRFSQPIHPLSESGKTLLGFDSFSASAFNLSYGITDKLYVSAGRTPICQRGMCRTIEVGFGYNFLEHKKGSPIALSAFGSVEGNENFTEEYTYNFQIMASARLGKRVYLFFSPGLHLNSNGQRRFNPRPREFFPVATLADTFKLPAHTGSFGFGASVLITHDIVALFDFVPRVGFKHGRVNAIFDNNFNVVAFKNESQPAIGFGVQKNIGKHSFTFTLSNTQTTTTSRYNSSNLVLSPRRLIVGFNLARRF